VKSFKSEQDWVLNHAKPRFPERGATAVLVVTPELEPAFMVRLELFDFKKHL
jgi:hypothetical protein